jgi:hypothetical protein
VRPRAADYWWRSGGHQGLSLDPNRAIIDMIVATAFSAEALLAVRAAKLLPFTALLTFVSVLATLTVSTVSHQFLFSTLTTLLQIT